MCHGGLVEKGLKGCESKLLANRQQCWHGVKPPINIFGLVEKRRRRYLNEAILLVQHPRVTPSRIGL